MKRAIESKEITFTSEFAFRLLMLAFWTQYTILNYVRVVFMRLPIIGFMSPYLIPTIFVLLIALSLPYMSRKIKGSDVLFYILFLVVVLMTMLIYPKNTEYIMEYLWQIVGLSVPVYFLGVSYNHDAIKKDLFWASLFGVAIMFLYQAFFSAGYEETVGYSMAAAYHVLPSILYLIYWALTNKGLKNWVIAILAIFVSFIYGTRGPILTIAIFLALGGLFSVMKSKYLWLKVLYVLLCGCVIYFFAVGENLVMLAENLSEWFSDRGFSTRIFDMIVEGEVTESKGRERILATITEAIAARPVLGYGFMGDRPIVGIYVHNLVYEMVCHYGTIVGPMIIAIIVLIPVYAIFKARDKETMLFLLMISCRVFVPLMLSGSYAYEPYLYLLLGLCIGSLRNRRQAKIESKQVIK